MMLKVKENDHCSFNKTIRNLFYRKQNINNSFSYTEEEKKLLTSEIEKDIYNTWNNIKYNLKKNKG